MSPLKRLHITPSLTHSEHTWPCTWYIRASAFTLFIHPQTTFPDPSLAQPWPPAQDHPAFSDAANLRDRSTPWILTAHSLLVSSLLVSLGHHSVNNFFFCLKKIKLLTFSAGIIALQCCVGFCHTSTCISHKTKTKTKWSRSVVSDLWRPQGQ